MPDHPRGQGLSHAPSQGERGRNGFGEEGKELSLEDILSDIHLEITSLQLSRAQDRGLGPKVVIWEMFT